MFLALYIRDSGVRVCKWRGARRNSTDFVAARRVCCPHPALPTGELCSRLCQFAVAVFEAFAGAAGAGVVAAGAGDFFRGGFA